MAIVMSQLSWKFSFTGPSHACFGVIFRSLEIRCCSLQDFIIDFCLEQSRKEC